MSYVITKRIWSFLFFDTLKVPRGSRSDNKVFITLLYITTQINCGRYSISVYNKLGESVN